MIGANSTYSHCSLCGKETEKHVLTEILQRQTIIHCSHCDYSLVINFESDTAEIMKEYNDAMKLDEKRINALAESLVATPEADLLKSITVLSPLDALKVSMMILDLDCMRPDDSVDSGRSMYEASVTAGMSSAARVAMADYCDNESRSSGNGFDMDKFNAKYRVNDLIESYYKTE